MSDANLVWLGHASFLIESGGKRALIDPFLTDNPKTPAEWKQPENIDAILLTHGHGDHIADAAPIAKRTGATIAAMIEITDWLGKQGVPSEQLVGFNKGGTVDLGFLKVTMVHALHSGGLPDGSYGGEAAGLVVTLPDGFSIYHAGDTCVFGDMRLIGEMYHPDLAILPIGGHYTMDPKEAAKAAELIDAPQVLGMHYGTFPPLTGTPADLRKRLDSRFTLHELEPGQELAIRSLATVR